MRTSRASLRQATSPEPGETTHGAACSRTPSEGSPSATVTRTRRRPRPARSALTRPHGRHGSTPRRRPAPVPTRGGTGAGRRGKPGPDAGQRCREVFPRRVHLAADDSELRDQPDAAPVRVGLITTAANTLPPTVRSVTCTRPAHACTAPGANTATPIGSPMEQRWSSTAAGRRARSAGAHPGAGRTPRAARPYRPPAPRRTGRADARTPTPPPGRRGRAAPPTPRRPSWRARPAAGPAPLGQQPTLARGPALRCPPGRVGRPTARAQVRGARRAGAGPLLRTFFSSVKSRVFGA